jgi:hypothetical protein
MEAATGSGIMMCSGFAVRKHFFARCDRAT